MGLAMGVSTGAAMAGSCYRARRMASCGPFSDPKGCQTGDGRCGREQSSELSHVPPLLRHPPAGGGQDIRSIQELLGHCDVNTTMIYTHVLNRGPWACEARPNECIDSNSGLQTYKPGWWPEL